MSSIFRLAKRKFAALVNKRSLHSEMPPAAELSLKRRTQHPPHKPPNIASRLSTETSSASGIPDPDDVKVEVNGITESQKPGAPQESWSGSGQFGTLAISPPISRALAHMGYEKPTPIQERVIPLIRLGQDLVGQAQTGTGKTTAFGLPIVETVNKRSRHPQALVLTPNRELALQVSQEISRIGMYQDFKSVAIYGGQPLQTQIEVLRQGVQVIVATPGRLMDHMRRRTLSLTNIKIVVLDEADKMLDIGFITDIEHILRQIPRNRQTLLFSATIPPPIRRLARFYLKNPQWIRIGGEANPVDQVEQLYYEVAAQDRRLALREVLDEGVTKGLIFRRTKLGVDRLVRGLNSDGHNVRGIHSDMSQAKRERVIASFKSERLRLLVATNLASRGLDIPAVSHVINYDMPDNLEEYVHRIGRTGRMGRQGTAITFVSEMQDYDLLDKLQKDLGNGLKAAHLNLLYN